MAMKKVCFLLNTSTGTVGGKGGGKRRKGKKRKSGGKRRKGKRRPMSPAQKKAFVARMKKARGKRR